MLFLGTKISIKDRDERKTLKDLLDRHQERERLKGIKIIIPKNLYGDIEQETEEKKGCNYM